MKGANPPVRLIIFFCSLAIILSSSCAHKNFPENTEDPPKTDPTYPAVIIDAGHGGEDGGAIGTNGVFEKDLNLKIALELGALLQASNINVIFTRTEDTLLYDKNSDYEGRKKALDMAARLAIARGCDNAIFISIHMNSFTQSKYRGLQVYYSQNSIHSEKLAFFVQSNAIQNIQPHNNRKLKASMGNIYLLEKIEHPAILIECGFISNPEECELLCSEDYRKRLSLCIYSSIITFFDSMQNNPSVTT